MEYNIDFNRISDDKSLEKLKAKKLIKEGKDFGYFITINSIEDFQNLESQITLELGWNWSMIISFLEKTIFLDKDI